MSTHRHSGHWDIVHATIDVLADEPQHARNQIVNNLATQAANGQFAHIVWWRPGLQVEYKCSHPPVWPAAAQMLLERTKDRELMAMSRDAVLRQIAWFEANRRAPDGGFYYVDMLDRLFESGVDLGVRFDALHERAAACVDACSHVWWLYDHAIRWSQELGVDSGDLPSRAQTLSAFVRRELFDPATGFFHDAWSIGRSEARPMAFEGIWPLVVGLADDEQASRVLDHVANPDEFLTTHPIATVAANDPTFELRMRRGPAWNSMTYWAATAARRYGRCDLARMLLERALDDTATQFDRTGTVWEFYHPFGGHPEEVKRKPNRDVPSRDYVGHNPLIAMATMWEQVD
jgi:glycogen debranching enzyme